MAIGLRRYTQQLARVVCVATWLGVQAPPLPHGTGVGLVVGDGVGVGVGVSVGVGVPVGGGVPPLASIGPIRRVAHTG